MDAEKAIKMIDAYLEEPHSINKEWVECLQLCRQALGKQNQKKTIASVVICHCPICKSVLNDIEKPPFCDRCGQTLDWSETETGGVE